MRMVKKIRESTLVLIAISLQTLLGLGAESPSIEVELDFSRASGHLRALHGVNKGPLASGGTIDLTDSYKSNQIPFIRLHDCMWPYPDVVDIHAIFRNPSADPQEPASYDFALTDEYLAAAHRTGARIIYRLGESIEHMNSKRFVHPPGEPKKWAQICLGIIRHYNEGWANGFHYGIQYFEIWNEPENRPAMWTGTDEQFVDLYRTAAEEIKRTYPALRIGGPGFGYSGKFENQIFVPSDFLLKFLRSCRKENIPLDFISWHCYTANVEELVNRTTAIRALLDREGFSKTESHLTEWNYLPDNSWRPFSRSAAPQERRVFYQRMSGPEGAAFLVASLIALQETALDVSCIFHGELGPFGVFDEFGEATASLQGIHLFSKFASPKMFKIPVLNRSGSVWISAATDLTNSSSILISNHSVSNQSIRIKIQDADQLSRNSFSVTQIPAAPSSPKEIKVIGGYMSMVLPLNSVTRLDTVVSEKMPSPD